MYKYFDETMSSLQARNAYFTETHNASDEVCNEVMEEYRRVLPIIIGREFDLADQGILTDG